MKQEFAPKEKEIVIRLFRSPTLDTISMVEKTIKKFNGELKKTKLWEKLPRKIMWTTYLRILDYLQEINKIIISDNGIITYIWDPITARKYLEKRFLFHNARQKKRKTKN